MAIKPLEFDFQESRWQDLYLHLKNKGYDVYAPAQKELVSVQNLI